MRRFGEIAATDSPGTDPYFGSVPFPSKGSAYPNMKELRFDANGGVWRVAFAFDPDRHAILLVAGDKSGGSEKLFYKRLIRVAEKR